MKNQSESLDSCKELNKKSIKQQLKDGKEFTFITSEHQDDFRIAEFSFNKKLKEFTIWFNGKLFLFKTFKGADNKLNQLIKDFCLEEKVNFN